MWFAISFIAFCGVLATAILKFEGVDVTFYVKVKVSGRKILDAIKNLFTKGHKKDE